jgi:hypothetical protein
MLFRCGIKAEASRPKSLLQSLLHALIAPGIRSAIVGAANPPQSHPMTITAQTGLNADALPEDAPYIAATTEWL